MSEVDESQVTGGQVHVGQVNGGQVYAFPAAGRSTKDVSFHRTELNAILRVYGRMVAAGEWRDYAIDHLDDKAVFSIFRRTSEMPLYRIEKEPALAQRQGAYRVVAQGGLILKRGSDLDRVLEVFDKKLKLIDV
jgi:Protein of unknown function (DUF2794)